MKKFLFLTALFLCGVSMAQGADNLLVGKTVQRDDVTKVLTIDISDITPQSGEGFVLSFTLNKGGIRLVNTWTNKEYETVYYANQPPAFASFSVKTDTTTNETKPQFYIGMQGTPSGTHTNRYAPKDGTFRLLSGYEVPVVPTGRITSIATCKLTEKSACDHESTTDSAYYYPICANMTNSNDDELDNHPAHGDITNVAITLANKSDIDTLITLAARVVYADGTVHDFVGTSTKDLITGNLSGWNEVVLNGNYIDAESAYLSYSLDEGETATKRNEKLLHPSTAPEPATVTLGLLALAGLAKRRRRA